MEVEELNMLFELKSLNEECFNLAVEELTKRGEEITPEAVAEIFDEINLEIERMNKYTLSVNKNHIKKPTSRIDAKGCVGYQPSNR